MSVLRRMSLSQRIVVVVAVGLLLLVSWAWWRSGTAPSDGGWFNYAPNSGVIYSADRQPEDVVGPIVLIAVWTAFSLWLLGLRPGND